MPTRKWWATQITATTALVIMYLTTGAWDLEESIAGVGIVSQAALAWLIPNAVDAAGVPGQPGQPG